MNKFKKLLTIFLMLILTVSIIAIPIIYNSISNKSNIGKKIFWEYTPKDENNVTANNVIDFVNNSYNTYTTQYNEFNLEKILAETLYSIDNDDSLHRYIKELLSYEVKCSQTDYWITVDNGPATLSIVFAVIYTPNEFIEIVFESNTKTLISFAGDCLLKYANSMTELYDSIVKYFKNDLKLNKNQFNFETFENEERLFLNCSLSHNSNTFNGETEISHTYIQN